MVSYFRPFDVIRRTAVVLKRGKPFNSPVYTSFQEWYK